MPLPIRPRPRNPILRRGEDGESWPRRRERLFFVFSNLTKSRYREMGARVTSKTMHKDKPGENLLFSIPNWSITLLALCNNRLLARTGSSFPTHFFHKQKNRGKEARTMDPGWPHLVWELILFKCLFQKSACGIQKTMASKRQEVFHPAHPLTNLFSKRPDTTEDCAHQAAAWAIHLSSVT